MSFSLTTQQIRDGTKTVTRRLGWWFLKPGDQVMACVKCMGLEKGEKIERIRPIMIISAQPEVLWSISKEDCAKEGFPELAPKEFIAMFRKHMKCERNKIVNRIEFAYF